MPLIIEDSKNVEKRRIPIPKEVSQYAGALYNSLDKLGYDKNQLKSLKSLTKNNYNKRGTDSEAVNKKDDGNSVVTVPFVNAKKELQRWPSDKVNALKHGGDFVKDALERGVSGARRREKVSPVAPPKPTSNEVKPEKVDTATIEKPNGTIKVSENKKVYMTEEQILGIYGNSTR